MGDAHAHMRLSSRNTNTYVICGASVGAGNCLQVLWAVHTEVRQIQGLNDGRPRQLRRGVLDRIHKVLNVPRLHLGVRARLLGLQCVNEKRGGVHNACVPSSGEKGDREQ